tara:strand:- start:1544 stop:3868 length:2325 start_codon:yes stop_codon:yes gene_type:complete
MKNSDNEVVDIELNVEVADARAKISKLRNEIDKLTKTRNKAKNMTREQRDAADQLALAEAKLAKQKLRLSNSVKKQTSAEEGSTAAVQRQINALMAEQKQLQKNSAQYAINARKINDLSTSINVSSRASGAATSSVMELGRVISDAPYGIRGMANNLSQLVSLMFYATTAAGGFTLALRQMWKALMGPLGIVVAITAAISALDYFSNKTDKTKKAMSSLNSTFTASATKLLVYLEIMNDSNVSLDRKKEITSDVNEEFKDLNATLKENGTLTDISTQAVWDMIDAMIGLAKAEAIVELIQKEYKKQLELGNSVLLENLSFLEMTWAALSMSAGTSSEAMADAIGMSLNKVGLSLEKSKVAVKAYMDMLTKNNAEIGKLLFGGDNTKDPKPPKDPKTKRSTDFSGKLLDFSVENDKIRDEEMKKTIIFEQDKLAYLHQAEMRELTQKKDGYVLKETLRYNAFIKKQQAIADDVDQTKANRKVAQDNILQAETEFRQKMILSEENYGQAVINMQKWQNIEVGILTNEQKEQVMEYQRWSNEKLTEQYLYKKTFMGLIRTTNREAEIDLMEDRNAEIEERINTVKISLDEELELYREFTENKTKILKLQSSEDAEVYEAQKFMMNSVMDSATSIFSTMKNNAKKGSDEQKKYALLEIYAGAAKGLMNGVLIAGEAAKGSATAAPFIYAGVLATQIASVYSSVQAAKKVLAGGSPSGGSKVATPTFSPNFNVVGNSDTNQLAESISDQTNSPTRAYVVYEDIATAGVVSEQSIESSGI